MKISVLSFLGLLVGVLLLAHFVAAAHPPQLPVLSLTTLNGQHLDNAALRGHPLLITFWSLNCGPCLREIPELVDLHNDLTAQGLIIIAIDMAYDPADHVLALARVRHLPYPIALDPMGKVAAAFGAVDVTPTTFLFDGEGRGIERIVGPMNAAQMRATIKTLLPTQQAQADSHSLATPRPTPHAVD